MTDCLTAHFVSYILYRTLSRDKVNVTFHLVPSIYTENYKEFIKFESYIFKSFKKRNEFLSYFFFSPHIISYLG